MRERDTRKHAREGSDQEATGQAHKEEWSNRPPPHQEPSHEAHRRTDRQGQGSRPVARHKGTRKQGCKGTTRTLKQRKHKTP